MAFSSNLNRTVATNAPFSAIDAKKCLFSLDGTALTIYLYLNLYRVKLKKDHKMSLI